MKDFGLEERSCERERESHSSCDSQWLQTAKERIWVLRLRGRDGRGDRKV